MDRAPHAPAAVELQTYQLLISRSVYISPHPLRVTPGKALDDASALVLHPARGVNVTSRSTICASACCLMSEPSHKCSRNSVRVASSKAELSPDAGM
eukprot:1642295-Prymnesium_polylepis.1